MSKADSKLQIKKLTIKWLLPAILIFILAFAAALLWRKPTLAPIPEPGAPLAKDLKTPSTTTTILLGGDVSIGRNIGTKIEQIQDPQLPFANLTTLLKSADIAAANLECPLSDLGSGIPAGLIFRCLTKDAAGLWQAGFKLLFTANNHAFDQGLAGLLFTVQTLRDHDILPVGTGANFVDAHTAQILKSHNILFGFLSYSYSAHNDGGQSTDPHIATMNDLERLKQDIWAARGHTADVVLVNMHAGTEYTRKPTAGQIAFAHAAIDAGADVVVGEHPHWIQSVEIYKNRPIFYSLGNLTFDQSWSEETRQGLLVKLTYDRQNLKTAQLLPVIIEQNCCARLASPAESAKILQKISATSTLINF